MSTSRWAAAGPIVLPRSRSSLTTSPAYSLRRGAAYSNTTPLAATARYSFVFLAIFVAARTRHVYGAGSRAYAASRSSAAASSLSTSRTITRRRSLMNGIVFAALTMSSAEAVEPSKTSRLKSRSATAASLSRTRLSARSSNSGSEP
jgi:hypothetical protein